MNVPPVSSQLGTVAFLSMEDVKADCSCGSQSEVLHGS